MKAKLRVGLKGKNDFIETIMDLPDTWSADACDNFLKSWAWSFIELSGEEIEDEPVTKDEK